MSLSSQTNRMVNDGYYEITAELDAREILRYLNYLGITNISGEVLKYFMTDLKKLIKYDLQQKTLESVPADEFEWSERLHSASTFSSRLRTQANNKKLVCSRECLKPRAPLLARNIRSVPNLPNQVAEKLPRRTCSCIPVTKKPESVSQENKIPTPSNYNLIKVPISLPSKKNDPVALYHYYNTLWEKYKPNMPGQNNWAELRWSTRQKMAGCLDLPAVSKKAQMKIQKKKD